MKIALLQMRAGIDPAENAGTLCAAVDEAAGAGATMMFTPEMSGLLDRDRARAAANIVDEADDPVLRRVRERAAARGIWVMLGSLAVRRDDGKLANRAFAIDGEGAIRARYDKLHMFDVSLPSGEAWRESAAYEAGRGAVVVDTPVGALGLSICYDVRFPALYQALSAAGAEVLAVPAAFTVPTGQAHWHVLLRARAIENAAFVVAAAQGGKHADGRETFGHSLVVDPWGRVLLELEREGVGLCALDLSEVERARASIPVLAHRRAISTAVRR